MQETYRSALRSLTKLGSNMSRAIAGYAVRTTTPEDVNGSGRLPMRSERVPIGGTEIRFDGPTHYMTSSASLWER